VHLHPFPYPTNLKRVIWRLCICFFKTKNDYLIFQEKDYLTCEESVFLKKTLRFKLSG
jgi:hypothetical protein